MRLSVLGVSAVDPNVSKRNRRDAEDADEYCGRAVADIRQAVPVAGVMVTN